MTPARVAPSGRAAGFTLIELLVVVAIIGVVLLFVTVSINPTSAADRLHTEAERLNALTQAAADDAVLYGRQVGLDIGPDGYRFLRLGADGWQPISDPQSPLRPRELGPGLRLDLISKTRGQPSPRRLFQPDPAGGMPDESDTDGDGPRNGGPLPDAVFLSSGEFVPFTLELSADGVDQRYDLRGDAGGRLDLKRIGGAG